MDKQSLLANPPIDLTPADHAVLSQTDEEFIPHAWPELQRVCASKDTSNLRRTPTDAWNYLRWHRYIQREWTSVTAYILQERLRWKMDLDGTVADAAAEYGGSSQRLFEDPADYSIRRNDWPYGCEQGITHLVVWSKIPIRVDGAEGDPLPEDERLIEGFVRRVFGGGRLVEGWRRRDDQRVGAVEEGMEDSNERKKDDATIEAINDGNIEAKDTAGTLAERVMWFRNRRQYQSVRSLEHIHVLLRDVDEALIEECTGQTAEGITALEWRKKSWD